MCELKDRVLATIRLLAGTWTSLSELFPVRCWVAAVIPCHDFGVLLWFLEHTDLSIVYADSVPSVNPFPVELQEVAAAEKAVDAVGTLDTQDPRRYPKPSKKLANLWKKRGLGTKSGP